ncbi:MAG: hypothetical protein M3023_02615 [Pseudomonadota bacterium]|nr:hypothetical protein [Pseudomonadota bacterium]
MPIRWIFALVLTALVCGCTSLDISPRENDLISGTDALIPVTIRLSWPSGGLGMGPVVELDGKRIPNSALTFTSSGATTVVALAPGSHRVRVRTAQLCRVCVGGIGEFDYTRRFFVLTSAPVVSLDLVSPTLLASGVSAE